MQSASSPTSAPSKSLHLGDAAPTLALLDYNGNIVELASQWRDRPLVLVFVRHAGCPLCRAHAAELRDEQEQFEAAGANVVIVAMGTPAQVNEFREYNKLPFLCLADETQMAYKAYGIPRGNILQIAGPGMWRAGMHSVWKHGAGKVIGDPYQLPGTVIVDTHGRIRFLYYGQDSSDWPTNETILAVLVSPNQTSPSDSDSLFKDLGSRNGLDTVKDLKGRGP